MTKLAVDSATPSMRPIVAVPTPMTLARKRGNKLVTISLDTSVKKLVALVIQTLRESLEPPCMGTA